MIELSILQVSTSLTSRSSCLNTKLSNKKNSKNIRKSINLQLYSFFIFSWYLNPENVHIVTLVAVPIKITMM
jgi:hypothetical protein